MRKIVVAAALAALVAGTGCKSLQQATFAEPKVTFKDVRINGLGLTGGSLDIVLNVYNPNRFDLDATRLTYKLLVGDSIQFGEGALDSRFTVQDNDSTTVRLPLSFTYSGIGAAGRQILNTGSVDYTVAGEVTVNTPIGSFTRPYRQNGRFNTLSGAR